MRMRRSGTLALIAVVAGCSAGDDMTRNREAPKRLPGPTVADLRELPGFHSVTVPRPDDRPTARIIHVLNWHLVPKAAFAADVRAVARQPISDDEIDRQYDEFLDEVESVQIEQVKALRALAVGHGVKRVFYEGLTADNLAEFNRMAALLRNYEQPQGETPVEQFIRWQYRQDMLQPGAPGRLLMTGELSGVLACEDPKLIKAANPVGKGGSVRFDAAVNEWRESAIVEALLKGRSVAVVVLGGAHDLSDNVPSDCEYVRLQTNRYREIARGNGGVGRH